MGVITIRFAAIVTAAILYPWPSIVLAQVDAVTIPMPYVVGAFVALAGAIGKLYWQNVRQLQEIAKLTGIEQACQGALKSIQEQVTGLKQQLAAMHKQNSGKLDAIAAAVTPETGP